MKHLRSFLYIYIVCLAVAFPAVVCAQVSVKTDADADSVKDLEALADSTADAAAWYNAGNAYYRRHDMARAVLCYERALRFNPSDEDAAYNLLLCRASLPDRFATPPEMFFISWGKSFVYGRRAGTWLVWSLAFMALAIVLWLTFRHTAKPSVKKVAFAGFVIAVLLTLVVLVAAALASHKFNTERRAVVMRTTPVRQRSTRTDSPERQLHAGTTVTLTGVTSPDSLAAATLPDGTSVWLQPEDFEEVAAAQ